jgi:AraC family transcriptional regulator
LLINYLNTFYFSQYFAFSLLQKISQKMPETNLFLLEEYKSRINRVMDYIENNLRNPLTLEELSDVANFSKFHFHRIFTAMVGETIFQFTQRLRLEKAASILISNPRASIAQIATDCGFTDQAVFARAFKTNFGVSATQWKKEKSLTESKGNGKVSLNDLNNHSLYFRTLQNFRPREYSIKTPIVRIAEIKKLTVAYVRNIGPYKGNPAFFRSLFNKLFSWAGPRGLLRFPETKTIVIYHDNPEITSKNLLRVSACITIADDTPTDGEIGKMNITPGRYAIARCEIDESQFQEAWNWVCCEWLPVSGFQPEDSPCFEMYHNDNAEHPEKKFILDICVPIKPL